MTDIKTIGRYEIKSEIAKGGMATVYHAYDPRFERDVAIKILPQVFLHDPQFRARFEREAKMIALLEHPAIVPVYDFGEEDGQPYIVMRYMSGSSLTDRLTHGPLSVMETAQMISRLAPALDAAHARNIIHRDLKPGNILFDQYGNAYLSDFGIARLAESSMTLTGESILGTPAYMSPEQVQGDKALDGRSDIYALGVLIFQMLTSQAPYQADTPAKVMMMHILQSVPNILELKPDLPQGCEEIINKAMAKRPEDRYATSVELATDLESLFHGVPGAPPLSTTSETLVSDKSLRPDFQMSTVVTPGKTMVSPPKAIAAPSKAIPLPAQQIPTAQPRRSRLLVVIPLLVALFLILAVAGGLAFSGMQGIGPLAFIAPASPTATSTETAIPTTPIFEVTVGGNISATTDTPIPIQPTTEVPSSPTPTETIPPTSASLLIGGADKVAYLNGNDIWVANLDGSDLTQLTEDRTAKKNLQWTPDGQAVNYISGKCIYSVFLEDKRKEILTCFNFTDYLKSFEISPDGKQIALSLDNELYLLPNDLNVIRSVSVKKDLTKIAECKDFAPLLDKMVKFNRWSKDSQRLAVVMNQVARGLGSVEAIQVFSVNECIADPHALVNFPPPHFTPEEYKARSELPNFGWDGFDLFAFATYIRNEGFGNLYVFNMDLKKPSKPINPVDGKCCYRDPIWSPDGSHLFFAFQQWPGEDSTIKLYYIPYGTLGTGVIYTPLPLPPIDPKTKPQPALRPTR